jgi:hypothetical protein
MKLAQDNDASVKITKEMIRQGIKEAIPKPSPQFKFMSDSPLKTPKTDRSPPTPNREYFNHKMKEFKLVKAQYENEKYEKNMIEIELKQSQEKIETLSKC